MFCKMSGNHTLDVNCPQCTFINSISLENINQQNHCTICNSIIEPPENDFLNQIQEADDKEKIITENYLKAYEEIPSSFIPASMIFLDAKIAGHDIRFLIDTGAQTSILPLDVVKACNLENILDQKIAGELKGVGSDRVMGRIHYLEVELSCGVIPCSFTVCENSRIEPILGIDMMQQMGLTLDFKNRTININNNIFQM